MNKVKLFVAGSSLAMAMFATGCGETKACTEITKKADCDGKKDKDDKECLWTPDASDSTKGTCGFKSAGTNTEGGDNTDTSTLQQQITDLQTENATLRMNQGSGGKLKDKVCMMKVADYSSMCNPATAHTDLATKLAAATDDAGKTAVCQELYAGYCAFNTTKGKCRTSPLVVLASVNALTGGAHRTFGNATSWTNPEYVTAVKKAGGMAAAIFKTQTASPNVIAFTDAYAADDPCSTHDNDPSACLAADLKLAASTTSRVITSSADDSLTVPGCMWHPGTTNDCMFDGTKIAAAAKACDDVNAKSDVATECGKLSHCELKAPNQNYLAPATTTTDEGQADTTNTNT